MGGKQFKLSCREWNRSHVHFTVFDPVGANCGNITVRTEDALMFVSHSWDGIVEWNGRAPRGYEDHAGRQAQDVDE